MVVVVVVETTQRGGERRRVVDVESSSDSLFCSLGVAPSVPRLYNIAVLLLCLQQSSWRSAPSEPAHPQATQTPELVLGQVVVVGVA